MEIIEKFREMIRNSWTYTKFTVEEADRWNDVLESVTTQEAIKVLSSEKNQWKVLQAIYSSYLDGLGYDGFNWREK